MTVFPSGCQCSGCRGQVAVQGSLGDAGLGAIWLRLSPRCLSSRAYSILSAGWARGRPICRPAASATARAWAARSAVKVRSISANRASSRKAMRPMPSSAVLIGSGSARDRTPMPFAARSCTRLSTSRRLRRSGRGCAPRWCRRAGRRPAAGSGRRGRRWPRFSCRCRCGRRGCRPRRAQPPGGPGSAWWWRRGRSRGRARARGDRYRLACGQPYRYSSPYALFGTHIAGRLPERCMSPCARFRRRDADPGELFQFHGCGTVTIRTAVCGWPG
jgi:hypothetical protein